MKKKYKWRIPCTFTMCGEYEIEAETQEEAIDIAENHSGLPPVESQSYVDGSFETNRDMIPILNEGIIEVIERVDSCPEDDLPLIIDTLETKTAKARLEERLKEV